MSNPDPKDRLMNSMARYYPPILVLLIIAAAVIADQAYCRMSRNPYDRGMENFGSQKYDAAVEDFQQALRRNPADIASRFELGFSYHQKNWLEEALKEYDSAGSQALQIAHFAYHNKGCILQNTGQQDLAVAAYRSSLLANPKASNSLTNLLLIYESRNQYADALRACQSYLEANPKDAAFLLKAGQISEKLNRRDWARQYYRDALALDANSPAKDRLHALSAK